MKLSEFEFDLPLKNIAQKPVAVRDHSRLMVLNRKNQQIEHDYFYNIGKYLQVGDTLVFNDTKVIPARIYGKKETGGKVEVLLLANNYFIGRNLGRSKKLIFEGGLVGEIVNDQIFFNIDNTELMAYLDKYGQIPLPPYIREKNNKDRYQTVYAKYPGSAAAPTAGFHFTQKLLNELKKQKIEMKYITLHVGLGTFAPIKAENIEDHQIHSEHYKIPEDFDLSGKRVVAVGTTSVRTLETWAKGGKSEGETDIYIYPGYEFKSVSAMVTNFHMPKSSLVLLVSAFAGREFILKAYKEAVKMGYRFGSFGDAMLII